MNADNDMNEVLTMQESYDTASEYPKKGEDTSARFINASEVNKVDFDLHRIIINKGDSIRNFSNNSCRCLFDRYKIFYILPINGFRNLTPKFSYN